MKFRGDGKTPEFPNGQEYRILRRCHLNNLSKGLFDSIPRLVQNLWKIESKHPYVEARPVESSKRAPLDKEMLPVSTRTGAGPKYISRRGRKGTRGHPGTGHDRSWLAQSHSGKLMLFRRYRVCALVGKDARTRRISLQVISDIPSEII